MEHGPLVHALVPLKDLVRAKTRLAGLLSPTERRALAQAMLEDVLAVLAAHPLVGCVTLVSDDPSAHLLATQFRAAHWRESELGCEGLNAVVEKASARLLAEGARRVLLVHGDLPLLTPSDIAAVLTAQQDPPGLVIGCDRHGSGTNMLCFDAAGMPAFSFGRDSCAAHLAAAQRRGIPVRVLQREGIGFDVDEPGDLALLLRRLDRISAGCTATFIRRTDLAARVGLALSSLDSPEQHPPRKEVN
jgi:2-phospho-L-lactate guanylyltransferase